MRVSQPSRRRPRKSRATGTYHVFPAGHEPLVDDFGGIVAARVDVYALLDDRV